MDRDMPGDDRSQYFKQAPLSISHWGLVVPTQGELSTQSLNVIKHRCFFLSILSSSFSFFFFQLAVVVLKCNVK